MKHDEAGFTLVELLVASAISVIIMGACAASLIVMLRNVDTTQKRLSESHDAQITSAYFATDVQSADSQTSAPAGVVSKTLTCPASGTTALATFTSTTDSGVITMKYFVKTVGAGPTAERQLQRTDGTSTQVLAHHLGPCGANGSADASVQISTSTSSLNHYQLNVVDVNGLKYAVTGEKRVK